MDHTLPLGSLANTSRNLRRRWNERRTATVHRSDTRRCHAITIALSREAGTMGTAVAREVGKRLEWAVYDHELLERIAQDIAIRTNLLESIDERQVGWLTETFESLLGVPFVSETTYVHRLVKTVLALGAHGECIIVGRGAPFILPAESTLRVRLIRPLGDAAAMRNFEVIDRERQAFVKDHFQYDSSDLRNYHLVLDFARLGIAGCAQIIVEAVNYLKGCGRHRSNVSPTK